MSEYADRASDFDPCQGTLVMHGDGSLECTDDACSLMDPIRHALIIDCAAVTGGCCAEASPHGGLARAS